MRKPVTTVWACDICGRKELGTESAPNGDEAWDFVAMPGVPNPGLLDCCPDCTEPLKEVASAVNEKFYAEGRDAVRALRLKQFAARNKPKQ